MLDKFSQTEQQILFDCLRAVAYGHFIGDAIFGTLMGVERVFVQRLADAWPLVDLEDRKVRRAMGSALNNMTGYPHKKEEFWDDFFSVDRKTVVECHGKWRRCQPKRKHGLVGFSGKRPKHVVQKVSQLERLWDQSQWRNGNATDRGFTKRMTDECRTIANANPFGGSAPAR